MSAPATPQAPSSGAASAELSDNDLDMVVGGLERIYVPGGIVR